MLLLFVCSISAIPTQTAAEEETAHTIKINQKKIKTNKAKEELKRKAAKAVATMWFDSPCGAGTRANAVQLKELANQQSSTESSYNANLFDKFPGQP